MAVYDLEVAERGEPVKSLCGYEFYQLVLHGVEVNDTRSHL